MVASRQKEIPFYTRIRRQCGRGFGALAQTIGRTAIPFLREYIVPTAKRVNADFLEVVCQKLQLLLVLGKISKQLIRMWEKKSEKTCG